MNAALLRTELRALRTIARDIRTADMAAPPTAEIAESYNKLRLRAMELFTSDAIRFPPAIEIRSTNSKPVAHTTNAELDWFCIEILGLFTKADII